MNRTKAALMMVLFLSALCLPLVSGEDGDDSTTHTLSGKVYDSQGNIAALSYIKVVPMASVLSNTTDGSYEFTGITSGLHAARVYFMNNGHTVSYRALYMDSDLTLDWVEGSNWITMQFEDENGTPHDYASSNVSVTLLETGEQVNFDSPLLEFNLNPIGQYYTLKTVFDGVEEDAQYLHFRMNQGNGVDDMMPNHFVVRQNTSNLYGYVYGTDGLPLTDTTISTESSEVKTNSDGFYRFENLALDSNHTLSFEKSGDTPLPSQTVTISSSSGWMNFSATQSFEYPGPAQFVESEKTIGMEPYTVEWLAGNQTNSYHLYMDGELSYTGVNTYYEFTPETQGSYEFTLVSFNPNGSTESPDSLLLIALGGATDGDLWSVGMSWDYQVAYTPASSNGIHNITVTALEKEILLDAFGVEHSVFKTRNKNEYESEGEKSYRWYDTESLLPIKTYWRDAPFESSYYQEGTLGWNFTLPNSTESTSMLSSSQDLELHFNRTNVIGVPGHPNGYDDTFNHVTIDFEEVTTPAGTFQTTHYSITDLNDGIVSWEFWYNETVRNFVKKVDRLPGSHSESVVYELASFNVPLTPQFITEATNITTEDYVLEWAEYQGAESYTLMEGDTILYSGSSTHYNVTEQSDGDYDYRVIAHMPSGFQSEGTMLELNVFVIAESPSIELSAVNVSQGDAASVSWQPLEGASWYAVRIQGGDGEVYELYNGTSTSVDLSSLDPGLNRIRVSAGFDNGKVSEYSSSQFINVIADEAAGEVAEEESRSFEIALFIALVVVIGWMLTSSIREE